MSPTLPIANVAPPPARGGDAARLAQGSGEAPRSVTGRSDEATRGDDGDFAQALSHAQRPCKPSHEPPHAKAARAATREPPARAAQGGRAAPAEPAQRADADSLCNADAGARGDASLLDAARTAVDGDATTRPAQASDEMPLPESPIVASDPIALPCAAVAMHRDALPAGDAPSVAAIEPDGERVAPRGHDRRTGADTDRNAKVPQSAPGGEAAATESPLHAAPECQAAGTMAVTATAAHAPSFDAKAPLDPGPLPPWHAAAVRDASAAVAPSAESHLPQASVHAAIDDAAFAGALGHQVALWVRDGVQEARLHLHPAELGPVAVQIALDGQTARVDFTAPVAATRDSIEQSLPALAAALRESGFTLTGGGVSSHTGGRSHDAPPRRGLAGGDRSRVADVADATPAAAARRWTRSLLDVYA
ncbi:MAG TPA: flagellar hook-length control protein FliK [Burkholderiaceae bacterium]|nr:flagellar hook-length control protein FliK [Burkholderiaceae bacterium]